jgi:hypothetical protein
MSNKLSKIRELARETPLGEPEAIIWAIIADELWFQTNPFRGAHLLFAFPKEIPDAKPGEVWLMAVRRIDPDDHERCSIKWPANGLPGEEVFSGEEIAAAFFQICTALKRVNSGVLADRLFRKIELGRLAGTVSERR